MQTQQDWSKATANEPAKATPEVFSKVETPAIETPAEVALTKQQEADLALAEEAKAKRDEIKLFDNGNRFLNHSTTIQYFTYPFDEMKFGQAFFIPVEPNSTVEKLVDHLHEQIHAFLQQVSECDKDKNGDYILETVMVQSKKRKPDGTIVLDSAGNPVLGASQINRPKLIYAANFIVKAVVKDDALTSDKDEPKAESDGALVICVM